LFLLQAPFEWRTIGFCCQLLRKEAVRPVREAHLSLKGLVIMQTLPLANDHKFKLRREVRLTRTNYCRNQVRQAPGQGRRISMF
jgi:hypothetical protein